MELEHKHVIIRKVPRVPHRHLIVMEHPIVDLVVRHHVFRVIMWKIVNVSVIVIQQVAQRGIPMVPVHMTAVVQLLKLRVIKIARTHVRIMIPVHVPPMRHVHMTRLTNIPANNITAVPVMHLDCVR